MRAGKLKVEWPPGGKKEEKVVGKFAVHAGENSLRDDMDKLFCGGYRQKIMDMVANVDDLRSIDNGFVRRCVDRAGLCGGGTASDWLECAKLLVEKKCDPNAGGQNGTALAIAVRQGHVDFVMWLIRAGADLSKGFMEDGFHPLHLAVCVYGAPFRSLKCIRALLEAGAPVNAQDINGCTPLHIAATLSDTKPALCLLKHGAKTNLVGSWRRFDLYKGTAFAFAAQKPHSAPALMLLRSWEAVVWVRMGARWDKACSFWGLPKEILYMICNMAIAPP